MTIVLDAGALIGVLNPGDAHHASALSALGSPDRFIVHTLNFAEALVGAEKAGMGLDVFEDLRRLGVEPADLGDNEPLILAHVRAAHGLRMPDTCALATAIHYNAPLLTFDRKVAAAAETIALRHPASIAI